MIRSFRSRPLQRFSASGDAARLAVQNLARIRRILAALEAAARPEDMNLPGYRFHGHRGVPKRWSVDVSGNYRITSGRDGEDAVDVDLTRTERTRAVTNLTLTRDIGL